MTIREIKAEISDLSRKLNNAWGANDHEKIASLEAEIHDLENQLDEIPVLDILPEERFGMAYDMDDAEMQDEIVFG